jgi:hypothetical protein
MLWFDRPPTVTLERPCPDLRIGLTAAPQAADVLDSLIAVVDCGLAADCFCKGLLSAKDGAGLWNPATDHRLGAAQAAP